MILYDLDLLESSRNAKDNKIGTRIVKDIKFLRRNITTETLRKFWDLVANDQTCPAVIASANPTKEDF